MYTYDKKSKPVNTKFVLDELNKLQDAIRKLDDASDFLYANVLLEEVKEYIKSQKKITTDKLQRRFNIGYVRATCVIELLQKEGHLTIDEKNAKHCAYIVNKNK